MRRLGSALDKNSSSEPLMQFEPEPQTSLNPTPMSLEVRLLMIDESSEGTMSKTPSANRDLAGGVAPLQAARQQSWRKQCRVLDAELAEARAELQRRIALRGPSGARRECDGDCVVGGCGKEFAEEQGVLCKGCQLFLCHPCFGSTVVANECVGGRYSLDLKGPDTGAPGSPPGSLPCPLFPQGCGCGNTPTVDIERALLHPKNRGVDGEMEDIDSPGHSPHKIYLIARRQRAERALWANDMSGGWMDEPVPAFLLRTVTQNSVGVAFGRTINSTLQRTESRARLLLSDKHAELTELHEALRVTDAPAIGWLKTCAQCRGEFAPQEGAQCIFFRNAHFMCNLCYGQYVMLACRPGGRYESEIRNGEGAIVSPAGSLPCPFLQAHKLERNVSLPATDSADIAERAASNVSSSGSEGETTGLLSEIAGVAMRGTSSALSRTSSSIGAQLQEPPLSPRSPASPAMNCHCGAVPMAEIERVLLDPRNRSASFWRERLADQLLLSQDVGSVEDTNAAELCRTPCPWSRELKLLDRGLCPTAVHESARLRVSQIAQADGSVGRPGSELDILRMKVVDALDWGGALSCPKCGVRAVKDDACVHMSCLCTPGYGQWCFLCGKESGPATEGKCPTGEGGCDEPPGGAYLEGHPGWGDFALAGRARALHDWNVAAGAAADDLQFSANEEITVVSADPGQGWLTGSIYDEATGETKVGIIPENYVEIVTPGESAAYGAQKEFLRRRQAYLVRICKEQADPTLWARFRSEHEALLKDVPTPGRNIDWDALDTAEFPLFGANKRNGIDPKDLLVGAAVTIGNDEMEGRLQQHWQALNVRGQNAPPPNNWQLMWQRIRRRHVVKAVYPVALVLVVLGAILMTEWAVSSAAVQAHLTCVHRAQTIDSRGSLQVDDHVALCDTDASKIDSEFRAESGWVTTRDHPRNQPYLDYDYDYNYVPSVGAPMNHRCRDFCSREWSDEREWKKCRKQHRSRVGHSVDQLWIPADQCVLRQCPVDYDGRDGDGGGCICELGLYYSRDRFGHKCASSAAHTCEEALQNPRCENECNKACQIVIMLPVMEVVISSICVWLAVALNLPVNGREQDIQGIRDDPRGSVVRWLQACALFVSPTVIMLYGPHLLTSGAIGMTVCIIMLLGLCVAIAIVSPILEVCRRAVVERFPCLECLMNMLHGIYGSIGYVAYYFLIAGGWIQLLREAIQRGYFDPVTGGNNQMDTVVYECTWICTWIDTLRHASMVCFLAALSVDYVVNFRAEVWFVLGNGNAAFDQRGGACTLSGLLRRLLKEPFCIAVCFVYGPVWLYLAPSLDTIAVGWFAVVLVPLSVLVQFALVLSSLHVVEYVMPRPLRDVWRGWRVSKIVASLGAATLLWLLWTFRISALQQTWPDSPWASSVRWQVVWIDLAALLVALYILAYDHGEPPDDVRHPRDHEIQELMTNAATLVSWPLLIHTETLDYLLVKICTIIALSRGSYVLLRESVSRLRGPRAHRDTLLAAQRYTPGFFLGALVAAVVLVAQLVNNVQLSFALGLSARTDFLCGGIECAGGRTCSEGRCCPKGLDGATCEVELDDRGFAPAYEVTGCSESAVAAALINVPRVLPWTGEMYGSRIEQAAAVERLRPLIREVCGTYYKDDRQCDDAPVYTKPAADALRGPSYTLWRDRCSEISPNCSVWRINMLPLVSKDQEGLCGSPSTLDVQMHGSSSTLDAIAPFLGDLSWATYGSSATLDATQTWPSHYTWPYSNLTYYEPASYRTGTVNAPVPFAFSIFSDLNVNFTRPPTTASDSAGTPSHPRYFGKSHGSTFCMEWSWLERDRYGYRWQFEPAACDHLRSIRVAAVEGR